MRQLLFLLLVISISSCSLRIIPEKYLEEQTGITRKQVLAVFMDGTNNKPHSGKKKKLDTHVVKLHELMQPRYRSFYIAGVGSDGKIKGLTHGKGTKERILMAYLFLSKFYTPGDSICLFGFSRGANQCRILSGMIYTFGILNLDPVKNDADKAVLVAGCYDRYRTEGSVTRRRELVAKYIDSAWNQVHPDQLVTPDLSGNTKIAVMGLWDTVEAFVINQEEEIEPVKADLNQVVNVHKIFHAVALDDNRSNTYTPILLRHRSVDAGLPDSLAFKVKEVWFSGSHRDVGGGTRRKGEITGTSLRWMLNQLESYHLFRDTQFMVYPEPFVHNGAGLFFRLIGLKKKNRSIDTYHGCLPPNSNGKLQFHRSVISRLEAGKAPVFKSRGKRTDWFELERFAGCFEKIDKKKWRLKPGCSCIEVVD